MSLITKFLVLPDATRTRLSFISKPHGLRILVLLLVWCEFSRETLKERKTILLFLDVT